MPRKPSRPKVSEEVVVDVTLEETPSATFRPTRTEPITPPPPVSLSPPSVDTVETPKVEVPTDRRSRTPKPALPPARLASRRRVRLMRITGIAPPVVVEADR
jgi:hypothetical protein